MYRKAEKCALKLQNVLSAAMMILFTYSLVSVCFFNRSNLFLWVATQDTSIGRSQIKKSLGTPGIEHQYDFIRFGVES